jgi:O-antigen ligase
MDNPILGVGLGNYNQKYQEYSRNLGLDFRSTARSAHSLYLEILAERGLFGVASFFVLLYYTFVTLRACEDRFLRAGLTEASGLAFAMMASFAAYLVTAMFLHDAFIRYFWLLLGLAWSVPQLSGSVETQVNARRHL